MTILNSFLPHKMDFIPDYAVELTKNYSLYSSECPAGFHWERRSGTPLIYDFSFDYAYRRKLFHVGTNKLIHIDPNAGVFLPLKSLPSAKAVRYLKEFEITRLTLEDTLEDLWSSGKEAEWYMHFAITYKISVSKIIATSPLLLTFFDNQNKLQVEYKNYPQEYVMGLAKFTNDKDELLNMLYGLPSEVIEAMI